MSDGAAAGAGGGLAGIVSWAMAGAATATAIRNVLIFMADVPTIVPRVLETMIDRVGSIPVFRRDYRDPGL